jgi:hypothetical protein
VKSTVIKRCEAAHGFSEHLVNSILFSISQGTEIECANTVLYAVKGVSCKLCIDFSNKIIEIMTKNFKKYRGDLAWEVTKIEVAEFISECESKGIMKKLGWDD